MTRINSTISVKYLTDEMLLAEHREIKRLPIVLSKAIKCNSINKIPNKFCLGTEHVEFLSNYDENMKVVVECDDCGFRVWYEIDKDSTEPFEDTLVISVTY